MSNSLHSRWQLLPALAVIVGVGAAWVAAWICRAELGHAQWAIWIGGAAALAGAAWFNRKLSHAEVDAEVARVKLRERDAAHDARDAQWEAARKTIETQLAQQSKQLATRESDLTQRLLTFHEWMEFPQPLDLSSSHARQSVDGDSLDPRSGERGYEIHSAELARQDRLLNELLAAETKRVFEDILQNKYMVEGKFQPLLARDDVLDLMRRVAKIYRPQVEEPLLETSTAQVFRAVSRACLQFLVLIEQLPLNLKEQTFSSIYSYVRQGVKAYGMYKSVEPYWPLVNSAYMLGRFALGANPLTLAAWWFIGALGQEGAKKLGTQLLHRQALVMLQSMVRVIGYETASLYGGDFRHRDPNWIYAVELAELVHRFPASRESLGAALKETGSLQLRHEYDRVYLYRCLAAHVSPEPDRYRGGALLTAEEKMAIARRLERFLEAFIHGQTSQRVSAWHKEVEERLGVKLNVARQTEPATVEEQTDDAIRSLASFLLGVKELEPDRLAELLSHARLYTDLDEAKRAQTLDALLENPPFFFEQPSLDAQSPLVMKYLQDLAVLAAKTAPHEAVIDEMLVDVAIYLRHDAKRMRQLLDKQYVQWLADQLPADAPERRFPPAVARAVLDVIGPREALSFVYGNVSFEWPEETTAPRYDANKTWLVGVGERLIVFTLSDRPLLLWRADEEVSVEAIRGYLAGDVRLKGGKWLGDVRLERPTLRLAGPLMMRHETYFKPLLASGITP